nr:PAS domain-containing protein [Pseudomonas lalucatii]
MDDAQVASAATTARKTVALALLGGGVLAALLVLALHRQRRALYRRQAALAAIVGGAQDAIIGSTLDGLVSSWNPAAQRLFGYRAEEAIGQPLAELVVPQALAEEDRSLRQRALAGEMLPPLECQRRRRDGSLLPVVLTVAPVATASGIIGLADTVRAPAAQPLPDTPAEDSRAALERLVQARTEQVRRAAGLSRAALAGAGHGVLATDLEGLITLCNPAAERLLGYAAEELVGQHTPLLWLDPRQLAQRAERFARELQQTLAPGFETLIAKTRRNLPNQHRWTLIRKDGSAQVALLTVTALHEEQGASQGLVVVAVEVPPTQPEPRAAALAVGPGAPRPAGVHARSRELSGLRLLLVEDNPTNRQVAHALLASAGAEVEVACDGEAGVAALASAQTPFDAVLMDIQLPGMDGYAACHEMRRRYASEQLPIIAMTANAMPADRAAALEAGMNEHIGKPFELATLVAVIRGLTGRGPRQAPAPVTGVAEPRPVLDSVTALRRFEGNQAIYRQALAQFIAQLAELPEALEEERARLRARLHNLKGLAATLGADAFAAVAGEAVQLLAGDCTPERWAEQGAALQSAGRDAAGAAGLLLAEVPDEVEARTPGPGMSEDSLHDELLALWQLLATHNMGALFAYDRLSKHYQGAASRPLAQLGEAIERLDFAAAMVQCQALLANREEE